MKKSILILFFLLVVLNKNYSQDCSCTYFFGPTVTYNPLEPTFSINNSAFYFCAIFPGISLGGVDCGIILPIELSFFNAIALEDKVELNWVTSSEKNNDFFTIEKSMNGSVWEVVSTLKGSGNSNQELSYSLYDYLPYQGDSYYRLKQTDFDGNFTYSSIQIVSFLGKDANSFFISRFR